MLDLPHSHCVYYWVTQGIQKEDVIQICVIVSSQFKVVQGVFRVSGHANEDCHFEKRIRQPAEEERDYNQKSGHKTPSIATYVLAVLLVECLIVVNLPINPCV